MTPVTKLIPFLLLRFVSPFTLPKRTIIYQQSSSLHAQNNNNSAEQLLAKAKAIRESIPSTTDDTKSSANGIITDDPTANVQNEFALPQSRDDSPGYSTNNNYKLTVDIGRESGTWMDPRWGASGRRIEFTVHWKFTAIYRVPRTAKVPRFRGTRGTRGIFAVLAVLSRYFFFHFAVSEVGSRYFKDGFP